MWKTVLVLTRPGGSFDSSSHSFAFKILPDMDSMSLSVSSFEMAANTSTPLPMEEMSLPSTVTEADFTLCRTATWRQQ
jgi:type VI protein secretion system component Hcp